ncbi:L,D-transpeptidase [Alcanivorax sp. N3-2A]|nr:L,D-transpeptidase [Alcanivorax sp. N3-2A]|tara:strand:- start:5049 stop:5546 length:498 start_codon:yes stop_codon:yes gene_type:complete
MQITISLSDQTLTLDSRAGRFVYPVSSALNGAGERHGSGCTPRGRHLVRARFGAGLPAAAVFQGRRFTGERWTAELASAHPGRDWMLSRILWLGGLEPGRNQGGDVDSFRRFIYIHGTADSEPMGEPASHGCIRMRNADVIDLFERVPVATPVTIIEAPAARPTD